MALQALYEPIQQPVDEEARAIRSPQLRDRVPRAKPEVSDESAPIRGSVPIHQLTELPVLRPSELRPGDILFFTKKGPLQSLIRGAGDTHRHVAVASMFNHQPWVLEAGRLGFRGRPLSTALATYQSCSAMRLSSCDSDCAGRFSDVLLELMSTPTNYPSRMDIAHAGALSMARHHTSDRRRIQAVRHAVERQRLRSERAGTLCSTLIINGLERLCSEHSLAIDLRLPKSETTSHLDPLAAHYALPDDIWRGTNGVQRYRVRMPSELLGAATDGAIEMEMEALNHSRADADETAEPALNEPALRRVSA